VTLEVVSLAERPDLTAAMWSMPSSWPRFMLQDLVAEVLYRRIAVDFPEYQLLALDDGGELVGRVNTIPFVWTGQDDDLPDLGWDGVLQRGFRDRERGEQATAVSLLEARVVPDRQGRGLSAALLQAARAAVRRLGYEDLFGPVRPTGKHLEPHTPMHAYVTRTRDDGLPEDPWLRVHVRLGGRVVRVCPVSMTIPGTLAEWREWTGLPLDRSGPAEVPGALVPVHVSAEHDAAVYVEPNVWVHHRL
jgi:GNAT superfamily N-acetyltransferase